MILIVDRQGNSIPVGALQVAGKLTHVGDNAWQVSQGDVAIHEREVTRELTVSRIRTVTMDQASRFLSATRERVLTEWAGTNEVTRLLSGVGTVSAGVSDLTVTRDFSATRMVTDVLTRERTVTREVSAMLSKPGATVTNMVTRELSATVWANISWSISYYPWWTRGTDYELNIQYYKVTGDDFDDWEPLDHTPSQPLSLSLVTNPTGDGITPTSVDTTGWVNGCKEVTGVHLYGGTGSGVVTIRVTDPELGLSLDIDINLNAAQTTKGADQCGRFYGVAYGGSNDQGGYDFEPDDWDAGAGYIFDHVQSDALANFMADTSLDSVSGSALVAQHYLMDQYDYVSSNCRVYGGFVRFYISDTDKQNLLATHLRIVPRCWNSHGMPPPTYYQREFCPWANRFNLKIKFSETGGMFGSGGALLSMSSPDISMSFSQIVQMIQERGGTPQTAVDVYIPFPKSVIENMTGNYLYAYVAIQQTVRTPFAYPQFKSSMTHYNSGYQYIEISNVRVELTK